MSTKTIPSIIAIEYIAIAEVETLPKRIVAPGDTISVIGYFLKLNITQPASCNTTNETTDAGIVYTTIVAGAIYDDGNAAIQHKLQVGYHCFRITDAYRNQYLIGLGVGSKPHPEITFAPQNDGSPDGIRSISFEIKWVSTVPPIELVDI